MKRRNFLKLLGMVVVAPGTAVAVIKARSEQRVCVVNHPSFGVINKQLRELIQVTLKGFPKGYMETAFVKSHKRQEKFQKTFMG